MEQDIVIDREFVETVSELVNDIALTSEADFENGELSYETAKLLIIQQIIPLMLNIMNDEYTSPIEKFTSLVAAMSHISLENFFLYSEIQKHRRPQ